MKFQNTSNKFKIILSVGDESGIGPEITLKALSSNELPENIDLKVKQWQSKSSYDGNYFEWKAKK